MKISNSLAIGRVLGTAALFLLFTINVNLAFATSYNYNGVITQCDPGLCTLAGVGNGDATTGSITIDVGPSDGFVLPNPFDSFAFLVGGVIPVLPFPGSPGDDGIPGTPDDFWVTLSGSGTTDASSNFATGLLDAPFTGGTLGGVGGAAQICLEVAGCGAYAITGGAGTFDYGDFLVTAFGGTVFVAEVAGSFSVAAAPPSGPRDFNAIPVMPGYALVLTVLGLAFLARRRLR